MEKFKVKENIDITIFNTYNFFSTVFFLLMKKVKKRVRKNKQYRDRYLGNRCFILGTGPSLLELSQNEIEILQKEYTFAVNSFHKVKITDKIIPSFYVLVDDLYRNGWSSAFKEINDKYQKQPPIFITDYRCEKFIPNYSQRNDILLFAQKYPTNLIDFDLSKNMFITMNVVSTSILSAIYMGFKEIFLLGVDHSAFCNQGKGHAYDDRKELSQSNYNLGDYLGWYSTITKFHYLIAQTAKKNNVQIINLNLKSLLDSYPRSAKELIFRK